MRNILVSLFLASALATAQPNHTTTKADVDGWMTELSNWGRWGKNDQLGTLNLITPAKRKQAAALVREGVSISLAHDVLKDKAEDNTSPFVHTMLPRAGTFWLDSYQVNYHGYAHTHMDALCHASYQGKMYNGFSADEVTKDGAPKLSILTAKGGVMTRRWARRAAKGPWSVGRNAAGLHASCARWLHDRGVAMVGSDDASDVVPSQVQGVALPIHQLLLVAMGVHIFDNCDLEALSDAAAKRKRWAFLLTAAPMAVPGGTGSPLNPVATY